MLTRPQARAPVWRRVAVHSCKRCTEKCARRFGGRACPAPGQKRLLAHAPCLSPGSRCGLPRQAVRGALARATS
eukprot:7442433-Pyramimonas_sp.AAC.1